MFILAIVETVFFALCGAVLIVAGILTNNGSVAQLSSITNLLGNASLGNMLIIAGVIVVIAAGIVYIFGTIYKRPYKNKSSRALWYAKKFVTAVLLVSIGLFPIVGGAMIGNYLYSEYNRIKDVNDTVMKDVNSPTNAEVHQQAGSGLVQPQDTPSPTQKRVTFIIYGLDGSGQSTRSDTMILGCFNTDTGALDMVSLPRDLSIVLPKNLMDILTSHGRHPPSSGSMKLGEIYAYAGNDLGYEVATTEIQNIFGVSIDYYVTVDLTAFKYIVTQIGGVDFDVPVRMKYSDPYQDLYIDLQPGMQHLDADQAEQLVRFRDHNNTLNGAYNDWTRGQTQQEFIKAIISQLMTTGTKNSIETLMNAASDYVTTNFDITKNLPKYAGYIGKLNINNINTHSLVGTDKQDSAGTWYTYLDMDASAQIIDSIFYDSDADAQAAQASSAGKQIEVLNGGYTSGMAQKTKDMLTSQGFTVVGIGDYAGAKQAATRIVVKRDGMGQDLQALFNGSDVSVDAGACAGAGVDIIVILGTDEG